MVKNGKKVRIAARGAGRGPQRQRPGGARPLWPLGSLKNVTKGLMDYPMRLMVVARCLILQLHMLIISHLLCTFVMYWSGREPTRLRFFHTAP